MKLIESKAEYIPQEEGLEGIYKQIELAGRTAYHSLDKITSDSAKGFVDRMIKSKHGTALEHGTVYLKAQSDVEDTNFWIVANSPYAKVVDDDISNITYITTNLRAIIELFPTTWHGFLSTYMCEPTEQHEKRYTMRFTCSRAIAQELTRHRVFSFLIESQRYINYSKERHGGEITCINNPNGQLFHTTYYLMYAYKYAEKAYFKLLERGCTPQQARDVLPNATKTELVVTGFSSDWKHLLDLRLFVKTGVPHPDMIDLMQKAQKAMQEAGIWEDIMSKPSKFE